jgi:hypothetical protein
MQLITPKFALTIPLSKQLMEWMAVKITDCYDCLLKAEEAERKKAVVEAEAILRHARQN